MPNKVFFTENTKSQFSAVQLCADVWSIILQHLTWYELVRVSRVCKLLHAASTANIIWSNQLKLIFTDVQMAETLQQPRKEGSLKRKFAHASTQLDWKAQHLSETDGTVTVKTCGVQLGPEVTMEINMVVLGKLGFAQSSCHLSVGVCNTLESKFVWGFCFNAHPPHDASRAFNKGDQVLVVVKCSELTFVVNGKAVLTMQHKFAQPSVIVCCTSTDQPWHEMCKVLCAYKLHKVSGLLQ